MARNDPVIEFWNDVEKELQLQKPNRGRAAIADPAAAIEDFRLFIKEHGMADMIYHRDPKFIAETIAGKRTFPKAPGGDKKRRTSAANRANGKRSTTGRERVTRRSTVPRASRKKK